jgi:hypothetical protein
VFADQTLSGRTWRDLTAARDGILTVEFVGASSGGSARLYDSRGTLVAIAAAATGGLRLDAEVIAGQRYRVEGDSVGSNVDVRVTNLVQRDGAAVYVFGTTGDDAVAFHAGTAHGGTTHEVIANGTRYTFDVATTRRVYLLGGGGSDTVTLVGTNNVDAAALRPGKESLRTSTAVALARGFETATVDGRGGRDAAYFADSQASETFTSWGDRTELAGGSSRLVATGFESVRARSFGGSDVATLHVDAATDRVSRVGSATMLLGANVLREVRGFQSVSTLSATTFASVAIEANVTLENLASSIVVSAAQRIAAPATFHADVFAGFARQLDAHHSAPAARTRVDLEAAAESLIIARGLSHQARTDAAALNRLVDVENDLGSRTEVAWNRLCLTARRPG